MQNQITIDKYSDILEDEAEKMINQKIVKINASDDWIELTLENDTKIRLLSTTYNYKPYLQVDIK